MEEYFIKLGYRTNPPPVRQQMYLGQQDTPEASLVYQYEVYEHAARLLRRHRSKSVLDIGCGCGLKLEKLIAPLCTDITGIDEQETISWCQQHHRFGTWKADNLEDPQADLGRTFDLIICADVIEHLVQPDRLLAAVARYAHPESRILLSTPERDATWGLEHMGPPKNPLHAREWSFSEFEAYVGSRGFPLVKHLRLEAFTPPRWQKVRMRHTIRAALALVRTGHIEPLSSQLLVLACPTPKEPADGK